MNGPPDSEQKTPSFERIRAHINAHEFERARAEGRLLLRSASTVETRRFGEVGDPDLSIVVVVSARVERTEPLLEAMTTLLCEPGCEVHLLASGAEGLSRLAQRYFQNFLFTDFRSNVGPSVARNIGAKRVGGSTVVFLDDDGVCGPDDVRRLAGCVAEQGAVAARGRIVPKTPGAPGRSHYDLGPNCMYTPPSTEGFSAWDRETFLKLGGFDPAMFGHEGLDLTRRALETHAPEAFRYCNQAVLFHDYSNDRSQHDRKEQRHSAMDAYMTWCGASMLDILERFPAK